MVTKSKEAQARENEKRRLAHKEEKERIDKQKKGWKIDQQRCRERKKQQQEESAAMDSTIPSTPTGGSNAAAAVDGASTSMKYLNEYDAEQLEVDRKDDKEYMNAMISSTVTAVASALKEKREQDHKHRMERTTSQRAALTDSTPGRGTSHGCNGAPTKCPGGSLDLFCLRTRRSFCIQTKYSHQRNHRVIFQACRTEECGKGRSCFHYGVSICRKTQAEYIVTCRAPTFT
jgi:hypothetical protein